MIRRRRCSSFAAFLLVVGSVTATGCFPHQPGPRLAHFDASAPEIGAPAPAFTLSDLDGNSVDLTSLIGDRPIVLQFGSHSCPVYRYRRFGMAPLWEDYRDRVHFLLVYTIEAHPVGAESPYSAEEWDLWINRLVGVRVPQATDLETRREQAIASRNGLAIEPQVVVDGMDNAVWQTWGAASSPAFVIDRHGRIAARQVWIRPKRLRRVLDQLLDESG